MFGKARLTLFALFLPLLASAEDDCYRDYLVSDQTVSWDLAQDQKLDFLLPTWTSQRGLVPTAAAAHIGWSENLLRIGFDFNTPRLSLPYNVYRIDLSIGEEGGQEHFERVMDFTAGCTEAGLAFYPGAKPQLNPIELPNRAGSANRGLERVRVRIWGVLR